MHTRSVEFMQIDWAWISLIIQQAYCVSSWWSKWWVTSPSNRRFFDPEFYRIVLLDQRGSGKSIPHACLEENMTWDVVADIEKLREHLEIPEWQVFGGSWGSTWALAYSQSHPDKLKPSIDWIAASDLEEESAKQSPEAYESAWKTLKRIQYAKTKSDVIAKADGTFTPREKRKKHDDRDVSNAIYGAWSTYTTRGSSTTKQHTVCSESPTRDYTHHASNAFLPIPGFQGSSYDRSKARDCVCGV